MRYRYFVHFRHGISVCANFSYGTAVLGTPQCPSPDAHANRVELFPATSRCMISCFAAVGCFHDLLIMIDESRFVIGLHQTCPFVVPRLFPSVEKRDKPSLTYISLKKTAYLRFPSKYDVCLGTNANILSKRKVACNFFKSRRLRCETLAPFTFVFYIALFYFSIKLPHL